MRYIFRENKIEIAIQKYNQQDVIHTLPTVKTEDMSTDKTIRIKESLLASTRHFSESPLQFVSFVEAFASMVQIYTFLFKQFKFYCIKVNGIQSLNYNQRMYTQLILSCRQASFIHSMRFKTVGRSTIFYFINT